MANEIESQDRPQPAADATRQTSETAALHAGARRTRRRSWLLLAGVTVVAAVVCAYAVAWYMERPLAMAESALVAGQPRRALELVVAYLEKDPENSRAQRLKARLLVMMNQPAEAIRIFEKVGVLTPTEMEAMARAYMLQEQWSAALPLLMKVAELMPQNPDVWYELTACRVRLGWLGDALESAQRFTEVSPHKARGYLFIASIQNDLKNRTASLEAFAKVLEYDPQAETLQIPGEEFFLEYGRTLLVQGQAEQAIAMFERSLGKRPTAAAWAEKGRAHAELGQDQQALAAWQEALRLDPANVDARQGLAEHALQNNQPEAALQWIQPLLQMPLVRSTTTYLAQRAYTMLGDTTQAEQWQKRTEELRRRERLMNLVERVALEQPHSYWARVMRAYQFAQQGNWNQAKLMLATVHPEKSDEPFVRQLAAALEQQGNLPPLELLPVRHE
jgi:tetratricopeptide (TPR) repeat protein